MTRCHLRGYCRRIRFASVDLPACENSRKNGYYAASNVDANMRFVNLSDYTGDIVATGETKCHPLPRGRLPSQNSELAHLATSTRARISKNVHPAP
jgi:hypothetical protein